MLGSAGASLNYGTVVALNRQYLFWVENKVFLGVLGFLSQANYRGSAIELMPS